MRALLVTLLSVVVLGSAVGADPSDAKLVVTGAKFFTMADSDQEPWEGYMVVGEDGKVIALGRGAIEDWPDVERLDLAGQWVLPGFVSAHSHLWQSAWLGC